MSDAPRSLQSWVSTIQSLVLTADVFQFFFKNMWEFRLTMYHTRCQGYCKKLWLVRGLKLHTITFLVQPCPRLQWVFGHWYTITKHQLHFPTERMVKASRAHGFVSSRGFPSGLHAHGALATISAPFRSGPSFPHDVCQWARRPSRVKLLIAMICAARSALRRWLCSNCERCCERIHCVRKQYTRFNIHVHGKTLFLYIFDISD